jgi:6-phosphogluconolactonase
MGEDGHFASLFADADNLEQGLDPGSALRCIPVTTAASPLRRVSLTLAALARSDEILLLVFGEQKRQVFEAALQSRGSYPVAALLALEQTPISIYWAP